MRGPSVRTLMPDDLDTDILMSLKVLDSKVTPGSVLGCPHEISEQVIDHISLTSNYLL